MHVKRDTYTGYGISCAGVWAAILMVGQRRLDAQASRQLKLVCSAWWVGWTSATIARVSYPPPEQLAPTAEKRLAKLSLVLVALGLLSVIRLMITRKWPAPNTQGEESV